MNKSLLHLHHLNYKTVSYIYLLHSFLRSVFCLCFQCYLLSCSLLSCWLFCRSYYPLLLLVSCGPLCVLCLPCICLTTCFFFGFVCWLLTIFLHLPSLCFLCALIHRVFHLLSYLLFEFSVVEFVCIFSTLFSVLYSCSSVY